RHALSFASGVVSFSEGNNPCIKRGSWVGAGHCVPSNSSRDLSRSLPSLSAVQGSRLRRSNTLTLSREPRVYLHVSFRPPPAARRLQRFVRRLVAVDARLDVHRGFLARAPARLKKSKTTAAAIFSNFFAC